MRDFLHKLYVKVLVDLRDKLLEQVDRFPALVGKPPELSAGDAEEALLSGTGVESRKLIDSVFDLREQQFDVHEG